MPEPPTIIQEFQDAIADSLIERGKLDQAALDRARRLSEGTGERLDRLLPKLGLASERDVQQAVAGQLGLPLVTARQYPDLPVLEGKVSARFLRNAQVLPLSDQPDGLAVAMVDPLDTYALDALRLACGRPVLARVAIPAELEAAIDRLYGSGVANTETSAQSDAGELDLDVERLKDLASEAPVIRLVNELITKAVEGRASDIHVEPFENRLRIRYRIDGVLREVESPPNRLRAAIVSRIKILARLNIAERRLPQDGRIKLAIRGTPIDLRVSTMPTMHGESVVLRVLDGQGVATGFGDLGIDGANLDRYLHVLERPYGIFLVTGPTGSGKTTTLYASLRHLNSPEKKILTVEDPIEYQIEGINQIQVKPSIGLDFANVLRSILRQDPDIILIGEIRDAVTAEIAVQAALTGHLVLSTLHTNTAAGAVGRLLDMGVEDYLLASALNGVASQRLVRTLCSHCRTPYRALPELVKQLGLNRFTDDRDIVLYRGRGCDECNGGYRGRTAIMELFPISERLRTLIVRRTPVTDLHRAAVEEGMWSMPDDGLMKALAGVTSIEEVFRVTREA
jgi:general secretion pathway protein E